MPLGLVASGPLKQIKEQEGTIGTERNRNARLVHPRTLFAPPHPRFVRKRARRPDGAVGPTFLDGDA